MQLVAIGDVGVVDRMIHIGDEAMFQEFVDRARQRGVDGITALSSNPPETATRYGVDALAGIGYRGLDDADSETRMSRVLAAAAGDRSGLDADDPALAVIDRIRASDGVVVTGGGNMSSVWPSHIFERATIGGIAAAAGVPLVVSGQTLGPALEGRHAELVSGLLRSARLVSVRERPSRQLARDLGIGDVRLNADDATFLGWDDQPEREPYCLVSLSVYVGDADRAETIGGFARLLDEVAARTGLAIRFLAHFASLDPAETRGDSVLHERVRSAMRHPDSRVVPTTDSLDAARLARRASLVVTSRYHPAVFATSSLTPTIAVPVDGYTGVKLGGVLDNFGMPGLLPVADLLGGGGAEVLERVWSDPRVDPSSQGLRAQGLRAQELRSAAWSDSVAWWDRVMKAFADG